MKATTLALVSHIVQVFSYEDLSFNKSTAQSSTYGSCYLRNCHFYHAPNAVDRHNNTCTRTEPIGPESYKDNTVWWYVDLDGVYSVYKVFINFKTYEGLDLRQRGRFAGFSLYLSNSTNIKDGALCYKNRDEIPLLEFNTTCIGHARYVFFYNERQEGIAYPEGYEMQSYTELCEVIVLGCTKTDVYGEECDLQCPKNCQQKSCDIVNGSCHSCKPGWTDEFCEKECTHGSFGLECKYNCSGHCIRGIPCNHVTGYCDNGCAAGWTGIYCEKFCPAGTFGEDCSNVCSGNCQHNETCSAFNGECRNGCSPGYNGSQCSKICPDGSFGLNCSGVCSPYCIDGCGYTDGQCNCMPGFKGSPNCNIACSAGYFGLNCQHKCSGHCFGNEICSRYDGSCSKGCKEPYFGLTCDVIYDTSTSLLTVGLAVVAGSMCTALIAVLFLFFRQRHCFAIKSRKSNILDKDTIIVKDSLSQKQDEKPNYLKLDASSNESSYETLPESKNSRAYNRRCFAIKGKKSKSTVEDTIIIKDSSPQKQDEKPNYLEPVASSNISLYETLPESKSLRPYQRHCFAIKGRKSKLMVKDTIIVKDSSPQKQDETPKYLELDASSNVSSYEILPESYQRHRFALKGRKSKSTAKDTIIVKDSSPQNQDETPNYLELDAASNISSYETLPDSKNLRAY